MERDFKEVVKQFTTADHYTMHNMLYDAVVHLRGDDNCGEVYSFDKLPLQTKWEMIHDYIAEHADNKMYTQFSAVELLNFADIQRDSVFAVYNRCLSNSVGHPNQNVWFDVKDCVDSLIDTYEMQTFENYKF